MRYSMHRLTDYEIAEAFQPILSGLYKKKMEELHGELSEVYAHLDRLSQPKYSDFERWFARQCLPIEAQRHLRTIDHIQRIRGIKVNDTTNNKELDIQKAKSFPIESLYPFVKKGKNVSCPFHTDSSPSASIKYNRLVCFSCGFKGDGLAFIMKLNNVDFKTAVRQLTNQ